MSVLCSIWSIYFAVLLTKLKVVVLQENFKTSNSLGIGDEESMHLFRNKILIHPTGASEVPFMRRQFHQMLINVGGLQKYLEDMVNSWN